MPIIVIEEVLRYELNATFDAEHRFLKGQEEMLAQASDPELKHLLKEHIEQSRQHVKNVDHVIQLLGLPRWDSANPGALGLVAEAKVALKQAGTDILRDAMIVSAAAKVEHYEIASYRGLIAVARRMGRTDMSGLLEYNLQQEETTALRLEESMPHLAALALSSSAGGAKHDGKAPGSHAGVGERMEVMGMDGSSVGHVKEVRDAEFVIDRPMHRNMRVPYNAVQEVREGRVVLNVPANKVDGVGWKKASLL